MKKRAGAVAGAPPKSPLLDVAGTDGADNCALLNGDVIHHPKAKGFSTANISPVTENASGIFYAVSKDNGGNNGIFNNDRIKHFNYLSFSFSILIIARPTQKCNMANCTKFQGLFCTNFLLINDQIKKSHVSQHGLLPCPLGEALGQFSWRPLSGRPTAPGIYPYYSIWALTGR